MSNLLWKIESKSKWVNIPKGIDVDIIVQNRTGKPTLEEISKAIEKKYNFIPERGFGENLFEFEKK